MCFDICVFDYDGTLCSRTDLLVSSEVIKLLQCLQNKSKLVLATGRPQSLVPVIQDFKWDATIYYNGQLCLIGNQIIHRWVLEDCEWRYFCQVAQQENIEFFAFSDQITTLHLPARLPCLPEVTGTEFVVGQPLDEPFLYKIITEPCRKVYDLVNQYMPHAQIESWHSDFWEIVPNGINKLAGVEHVLSHMDWFWSQVIAFGDSENDCPLFQRAAYSIAIGDQCAELVQLANYVAPTIEQNGLEKAIKKIMHDRRRNDASNHQ